jgi:hypothetical protein
VIVLNGISTLSKNNKKQLDMKALRAVLILACCYGLVYGYWGAFTTSGNQKYEGMSALLPFYIMIGSIGILSIIGLYYLVILVIKRK